AVTVNLNGLQGNAIRYFLDGIPLDYLGRAFDLSIVPIGQLSGVEVYKGILPATLGADALGGAVNLISAALEETQLDVSYSLGSFNTHQANLNAYVAVPKTKLYLKLTSYYIHADNNYPMEVMVVDSVTQNLVPASVRRFHDRVSSGFAQISAGVKDTRWADQFEIGYAYFDYQKDEQHGFNIAEPFGEVVSYENFGAIHGRYRKQFGKLDIDLFGAFNQKNQRFVDTTRLRYGWDGEVTNVTNGNQGESAEKSLQSLEFQTWVARANLSYQLGPATISLIHNANMERRVGEDPFGLVSIGGEFIDPLHQPATYDKHITGLQLTIPYWNGRITQVFTAKRYYLNTTTYESWRDSTLEVDHLSYGLGTSLKYTLGANRFIRASYEHATRIPGSQEYFGDGIFLLGNPFLEPERSHNVNLGFYTNLDHKNRWWLDVNAFYRDVDDQILQQAIWLIFSQYRNKDGSRVMGIETSLKTTFFNRLQVSANVTLQDARRINITDVQQQGMEGARLPFQPFFYTNLNVNYSIPNLLGQGALLSLYGSYAFTEKYIFIQIPREHEPAIFSNVANSPLSNLGDFIIPTQHLVNAGASYKFGKLPLWINLEVNNALNLEIYDNFRVPRQPINLMAKIRYKFH
ncbi:MAG: outer membrane beta-barrel protein, partial [Bacteroidota bacterium]